MKIKNQYQYQEEILSNINFRNNQNYIVSNDSVVKHYKKYIASIYNKYVLLIFDFLYFLPLLFYIFVKIKGIPVDEPPLIFASVVFIIIFFISKYEHIIKIKKTVKNNYFYKKHPLDLYLSIKKKNEK